MGTTLKLGLLKTAFILAYFLIVFTAIQAWAHDNDEQTVDNTNKTETVNNQANTKSNLKFNLLPECL